MKLSTAFALSLTLGTSVFVSGCGAHDEIEEGASSEEALRALGGDEIVGEIAFGTSAMEVQHPGETSSRRVYRAVSVHADKGDVIDATAIAGNAADPVLYVLDSAFRTLKSNDDDRAGDKSSHVTYKVARSGTYYLAFRTKEGWRTKFYVSLRAKAGGNTTPPPVDPPPPVVAAKLDVFAPSSEPRLSDAEVTGLFAPATSTQALGTYRVVERRRTCNELTGCTPFAASTNLTGLSVYFDPVVESVSRGALADGAMSGTTTLRITSAGFRVSLGSAAESPGFWIGPCSLTPSAVACSARTIAKFCSTGGTGCDDRETGVVPLHDNHHTITFDVSLSASFLHGRSPRYKSKVDAARSFTEAEFAFVASTKGRDVAIDFGGESAVARAD